MDPLLKDVYLANFHTHTTRCMHAEGAEEEYVRQAIAAGFDCIGFADHTPWPYKSDFVSNMRMPISQAEDYFETIRALQKKYAGQIRILLGLECEAFPEFYGWLEELKRSGTVDYIILGNHYDTNDEHDGFYFGKCRNPEQVRRYVNTTLDGMESGLFAYLAHPDLYLHSYPEFDETAEWAAHELCRAAKRLNMPLEYNLLGRRRNGKDHDRGAVGYTSDEFWNIAAQAGIRAIIGVDAHQPEAMNCAEEFLRARRMLEGRGVEVLDMLPGLEK